MKQNDDIRQTLGKLEEFTEKIQEMLEKGLLTKEECNELICFDILDYEDLTDTDAFKLAYEKRHPIKCSELILKIFDQHKSSFRKAIMLSECIPDPLGMKYDSEEHEFCLQVLKRSFGLAKQHDYPAELLSELKQIYSMLQMLNHNNLNNIEQLQNNNFSDFSLSEQLRMICLYLQDQSRLSDKLQQKKLKNKDYVTGMESAIADRKADNNPHVKISAVDNFEGFVEYYDTLIRYLYYKKGKELKIGSTLEHGDITHLNVPSFELITHISAQRVIYTVIWEKFKYSQWQLSLVKKDDEKVRVLNPKHPEKFRQHRIAVFRRNYILMTYIYQHNDIAVFKRSYKVLFDLSNNIALDNINSLYTLNKDKFLIAKDNCKMIVETYKHNANDFYLKNSVKSISTEDIIKCFEFLHTLAECYKTILYKNFEQENISHYKYLSPIVSITELSKMFSKIYEIENDYALKILNLFIFDNTIKSDSDIFCRPLIFVAKDSVLFCPILIQQMNLDRIIEMLFLENNVDLAPIGKAFENELRLLLSLVPSIQVNTNKIEFLAYDGRDVEFDFIGTFEEYLLLIEFKALTTPYSDKRLYHNEKVICEGVDQVNRRSAIIQQDWYKIREMCNIELPEKPIEDSKIIKLVGTNIFDFTTLIYNGVRVIDDSTLLKFFLNPSVKVVQANNKKVMSNKKLWKGNTPTVQEFLEYLDNPVTTAPYKDCFESQLKTFDRFENDYLVAVYDENLIADPYAKAIGDALTQNPADRKVGRNVQCPCGSGLKYKKCCGK